MLGLANRGTLVLALALTLSGCELLPGLLSGPGGGGGPPGSAFTTAALTVEVERAEGTLAGRDLDAQSLTASGFRSGSDIQLELVSEEGASMSVMIFGGGDSSTNPYVGGPGGPFDRVLDGGADEPPPIEIGLASVMACSPGDCQVAEDFGIEIAELAEGRTVLLDGAWSRGDRVHVELRYRELR